MWHYGETMGFAAPRFSDFLKTGLRLSCWRIRVDLVPAEYALRVADLFLQQRR